MARLQKWMIAIQSDGRDLNLQLQQNVTVQSFDSMQISTYQIVFFFLKKFKAMQHFHS